ncbi:hypothetical protein RRG08_064112 [Elysia crispata]|uniref:Uncharacterized protein n=1 Tax=Elysia crispata TaxID=231223 RepID=A0AAE1B649_9GAST|nr:hypothetical protein RRG08_064112 [Elysia crispata]
MGTGPSEKSCPAGTFGLDCERQCNCTNQISCFVHSGGCASVYSPDYSSMECPVLSAAIEPKKPSESTSANCTRICSAASPATGSRNDGNDPQLRCRKTCSRRNPATDEQSGNTEDSAVPPIVAVVVVVVVFVLIVALVLLWRRCLKKSARSQGEETGISLKSMQETVK